MKIGALKIDLEITDSTSLKDKRMVIKSMKDRLRKQFNISIAEIDENDKWQRSTLGISSASNDKQFLEMMFNKIIDYIENEKSVIVLDVNMEIL